MIHKGRLILSSLVLLGCLSCLEARADRRTVLVVDSSSSGRLVRISAGANVGLLPGQPVLFSSADKKVAAGRVYRVEDSTAVIAVLEKYGEAKPEIDSDYELLFGEPFLEAANLPDYVVDRESENDNPGNETFLQRDSEELTPELDDDNYTPEVTLRPKFPDPRTYNTHNLTIGLALFRNNALATTSSPDNDDSGASHTTYQGYTVRYAYTFRTHYWLKARAPALVSAEGSFSVYNFQHTFSADQVSQIRVVPLAFNLRYMIEVSKLFRLYPYAGYQYNIVSAANGDLDDLQPMMGGRLFGGAGGQLVMSNSVDARLEGGSDGVMAGLVVKF